MIATADMDTPDRLIDLEDAMGNVRAWHAGTDDPDERVALAALMVRLLEEHKTLAMARIATAEPKQDHKLAVEVLVTAGYAREDAEAAVRGELADWQELDRRRERELDRRSDDDLVRRGYVTRAVVTKFRVLSDYAAALIRQRSVAVRRQQPQAKPARSGQRRAQTRAAARAPAASSSSDAGSLAPAGALTATQWARHWRCKRPDALGFLTTWAQRGYFRHDGDPDLRQRKWWGTGRLYAAAQGIEAGLSRQVRTELGEARLQVEAAIREAGQAPRATSIRRKGRR